VEQPRKAPVIDLMEALKHSLESGASSKSSPKAARSKKTA
jgi:non-homologous end joining protein Ku